MFAHKHASMLVCVLYREDMVVYRPTNLANIRTFCSLKILKWWTRAPRQQRDVEGRLMAT